LCDLGCAPKNARTRNLPTYLARRLATAELQFAAVMMTRARITRRCKRVTFTLFHRKSGDLFFSCCAGHHDQVPAKNSKRSRGHRPKRTRITQRCSRVKCTFFRCTSAEIFFFSCCGSVMVPWERPGHNDEVPAKNNEQRRGNRSRRHDQVPATHNCRRRGEGHEHRAQLPARRRGL